MKVIRIVLLFCMLCIAAGNSKECLGQSSNTAYLWACSFGQNQYWTAGFVLVWNHAKSFADFGSGVIANKNINIGEHLEPGTWSISFITLELYLGPEILLVNQEYNGAVSKDNKFGFTFLNVGVNRLNELSATFQSSAAAVLVPGAYFDQGDIEMQSYWTGYSFAMEQIALNPLILLAGPGVMF